MVCLHSLSINMSFYTLITACFLIQSSIAGYVLEDDYTPSNFFDMFSFFTDADPTHGFVNYVDQSTAQSDGLISTTTGTVYMGVDSTNQAPSGRNSVRLTSNKSYGTGSLIILDLAHMPGGICGTWPAFWTVGPDWPYGGEIDIIEGVNEQSTNDMTLHTSSGCSISDNGAFSGSISTDNCDVNAAGQSTNAGCQIDTDNSATYGTGFNSVGGGVYAMEWTSSAISIYFFQRGSIPSDIKSGSPNPSGWGTPLSQFTGGCDIPTFFQNQSIVFDTTFCGDWAGNSWSSSSCASQADTCNDFVANNPSAFVNAFWTVNSLQVYQQGDSSSTGSAISSVASAASSVVSVVVSAESSVVAAATTTTAAATSAAASAQASSTAAATTTAATTASAWNGDAWGGSAVTLSAAATSSAGSSADGVTIGGDGSVDEGDDSSSTTEAKKAHQATITISISGTQTSGQAVSVTSFVATSATTIALAHTTVDIPVNAFVMVDGTVGESTEQKRSAEAQTSEEVATGLENENIKRMRHVRHINSHRRGGLWMH